MNWSVVYSGAGEPAFNMAMDEVLLEAMPELGRPVLRFYSWTRPAASFGYFQRYREVEQWTSLRPLVRRPTGGGVVPHDGDWTYCLAFPATHPWYGLRARESYGRVHEWIRAALSLLAVNADLAPRALKSAPGRCFAGYEESDVLWRGRKIAGAAQRRTRQGLLIQGSVQPPPADLARKAWEGAMLETGAAREEVEWSELDVMAQLAGRAERLAEHKYSRSDYNEKR